MLTIPGQRVRLCDGVPRRDFLAIGSLALGGLSLPQLLQAESKTNSPKSHKSVIMIYLTGGPPHQDMFDLKPQAPKEVRGPFNPISTNLPGVQIGEHFPRLAKMMDKVAIIRSLIGSDGRHSSFQCATGRRFRTQPPGGWPEIGSIMSKKYGPVNPAIPPALDLSIKMAHQPYNLPGAGFLGRAHAPVKPQGNALQDMVLKGVNLSRLENRKSLLQGLDSFRRYVDREVLPKGVDKLTENALNILTSNRLAEALDLSKEDPKVRARYGKDDEKVLGYSHLGYKALMSKFLAARRLVEAGARVVTVAFADFDWHGGNFSNGRKVHPLLDQGVSALISDLHERGLDKDVTVVVWGEFGRTPKINKSAGRDHWSRVCAALVAGGGLRTGQVIGATNRLAEEPTDRPIHFHDVFATIYHALGVDAQRTTISDLNGRPRFLAEQSAPIRELI